MVRPAWLPLAALLTAAGCSRPGDPPASAPSAGDAAGAPAAAAADRAPEGGVVPIRRLSQLPTGGPAEARQAVVRTAAEWTTLWEAAGAGADRPEVNFDAEDVVVAASGTRRSGGHEVSVESIRDDGTRRIVTVLETSPGSGCMTTQAISEPVDFVAVPRRQGAEYTFTVRREATPCE